MNDWLAETRQLDLSHPKLRITAQKLTQRHQTFAARAVAIHDFVRRMDFVATPDVQRLRASDVLLRGEGDCHAKGLLFVALCRAAGLPARLQFVRVRGRSFGGMFDSPPEAITVAVGQVQVEGRWVTTDGYVVDPVLFAHAKRELRVQEADSGWGIVCDARGQWDGRSTCIQHFRTRDVVRAYGAFDDLDAFHAAGNHLAQGRAGALKYAIGSWLANWRVARLRSRRFDLRPVHA